MLAGSLPHYKPQLKGYFSLCVKYTICFMRWNVYPCVSAGMKAVAMFSEVNRLLQDKLLVSLNE